MRNKIEIKKSWFYSAGDKYGWTKDSLDVKGVGVLMSKLHEFKHLILVIDKESYYLDCQDALNFINKYHSTFKTTVGDYMIGVVSRSVLRLLK